MVVCWSWEEILKLEAGYSIGASLLTLTNQGWIVEESVDLPPRGVPLNVLVYDESHSGLEETLPHSSSSPWRLIEVPSGFDVIDAVLVNVSDSPAIFGIQITRSVKPFAKHHTSDTCHPRSQERLARLWNVISDHFELDVPLKMFYVMLAPNCERDEFKPPKEHERDCYFAPSKIFTEHLSRKRSGDPVTAPKKKQIQECCRCGTGVCTSTIKKIVSNAPATGT